MKKISLEQIITTMAKKGYRVSQNDSKNFNLNIVGIRAADMTPNVFNDLLVVFWKYQGKWYSRQWSCTTDPGTYWLKNPGNVEGTAILKEGQIIGMWKIGLHRGQYKALVQNNPCVVYRDRDKDAVLDAVIGTEDNGVFGINLHKAGENSIQVDKWSAGCQVFARIKDFNEFMVIADESAKLWGNSFTYSLLKESDIT